MKLKDYIPRGQRDVFARRVGITTDYLHQICAGTRRPAWDIALQISDETRGQVSVEELNPLPNGEPYPAFARLHQADPLPSPEDVKRRNPWAASEAAA